MKIHSLVLLSVVSVTSCSEEFKSDRQIDSSLIKDVPIVSHNTLPKKYHYREGKCVNDAGQQGYNPPSSIFISPPVEKMVNLQSGNFHDDTSQYTYYETVDAECVNFDDGLDQNWLPKKDPRVWINTLNLAGATGNTLLNSFDSPRVMLEGVVSLNHIQVYSSFAASVDQYTKFSGCWPLDQVVEPIIDASVRKDNSVWCSTNSKKLKSDE